MKVVSNLPASAWLGPVRSIEGWHGLLIWELIASFDGAYTGAQIGPEPRALNIYTE